MRLLSRVSAILVLSASTLIAHADSVYTYTGQDFTSVVGPLFTTSDFVSGSFTTATPLADDLDNATISLTSFSFNDGVDTISNTNGFADDFLISTNASGAIVEWGILVISDTPDVEIQISGGQMFGNGDTALSNGSEGGNSVSGVFTSSAPTSVTPEPSTLALLGTGILGVAGMMRRKFLPQS
jgi:hypothetical protein